MWEESSVDQACDLDVAITQQTHDLAVAGGVPMVVRYAGGIVCGTSATGVLAFRARTGRIADTRFRRIATTDQTALAIPMASSARARYGASARAKLAVRWCWSR